MTLYFILAHDSNEELVCSATSWRCRPVGIGANMVRSTDTTAAQSAAPIAPIAPIAAHTCYLKVILLVLILPPCGDRSQHGEERRHHHCPFWLPTSKHAGVLPMGIGTNIARSIDRQTHTSDHSGAFSPHIRRERIIRRRKQRIIEKM